MAAERIDLGSDHWLEYSSWTPDRQLNPQFGELPDVERWGATIGHPLRPDDTRCTWRGECVAGVTFSGPVQLQVAGGHACWTVESWEPLTLSPSLLCHCGDHGFIRDGRWVA